MFFKSIQLYRLHDAQAIALTTLEEALEEKACRPLGSVEAKRMAWGTPGGRKSTQRVHEVQGHRLLSAIRQERVLPASVVKEELEERVGEREDHEGRSLTRSEKQAIKEQIQEEFLPRAFVRKQSIDLWWDTNNQLIGVNASSKKRAEEILDLLRETLGNLKVTPLATRETPTRANPVAKRRCLTTRLARTG